MAARPATASNLAPVTVVTGFLGSGKTTLINRILHESHGQKIAVIENEFGAVGVDARFLAEAGEDAVILLANGCVCCTVRGDLTNALYQLIVRSDSGAFVFDRLLIETTGLADPGPVVQTFLADMAVQNRFRLDGVVTLVDALNAHTHLERIENRAQIAYADRLLLTKTDLAGAAGRQAVQGAIARVNARAPLVPCDLNRAPIGELLAHLFDSGGAANDYLGAGELMRAARGVQLDLPDAAAGRLLPVGLARHTQDVVSCAYQSEAALDLDQLTAFLDGAVRRLGTRLWRCKGIVHAHGQAAPLVLQGVQGLLKVSGGANWRAGERPQTTLVFIGERLEREWLLEGLRGCEIDPGHARSGWTSAML